MVTAVLLNYARPFNLTGIVERLSRVSRIREILVWNNGPLPISLSLATAVYHSDGNRALLPRLAVAVLARWPTVLFHDDDLLLEPAQLARLLDTFEADPDRRLHGVQGRRLTDDGRYCGDNVFGPCDIVNQTVICPRAAVARALAHLPSPFWQAGRNDEVEDDILLSLAQGRGRAISVDVGDLHRRDHLSAFAWSARPHHAERRQQAVDWMLRETT